MCLVCYVLILCVAFFFFLAPTCNCRPQFPPSSINITLNSNHSSMPKSLMIAELKSRILKHLKFSEPIVDSSVSESRLSKDVIPLLSEELDLTDATPRENIIIHAINQNFSCLNSNSNSTCQRFEFIVDSELESMISVHIWLHRRRPFANLKVSVYSSRDSDSDLVIQMKEHHAKFQNKLGWITFELPKSLAIESRYDGLYCTIEVEGSLIDKNRGLSPFLVIARAMVEQRRKRQAESRENCNHCCAENQNVTVEELNWDTWVISPRVFDIKTCKGQCPDTLSFHGTKYQSIMNTLHKLNSSAYPKPDCVFWTPSCRPTGYLPLRLMYDYNGTVHDQVIPNVIIESCQCQ